LPEALFVKKKIDPLIEMTKPLIVDKNPLIEKKNPPIVDKEPLIEPHPTDATPTQQQKAKTKKTNRTSGIFQKLCLLRKRSIRL